MKAKTCQLCQKTHKGPLKKLCNKCVDSRFAPWMRAFILINKEAQ